MVNSVLKVTVQYKHIIIGFVNHLSTDLSYCITIIAYCIYKHWLICSIGEVKIEYKTIDVTKRLKDELYLKIEVIKLTRHFDVARKLEKLL